VELDWPIYLGDRPGPWARAAACNAAAAAAGRWDVALVTDADTIPSSRPIREAVQIAYETHGAIRPHDRLYDLNRSQSLIIGSRGPQALTLSPRQKILLGGGLLVISRRAWESVGGYDERFIGWGHEDSAMNTSLLAEAYWDRIPGEAWHLWHPRDATDTPERRTNRRMMAEIQHRHRPAIEKVSRERGWDVGAVL
jgi:hypothetical protein